MRTNQCGRVVLRLNIQADALARPAHVSCFRVQHDFNPVLSQDFANFFRDIGVLAGQKLARALNDRYSTAKAPEKLANLTPNDFRETNWPPASAHPQIQRLTTIGLKL